MDLPSTALAEHDAKSHQNPPDHTAAGMEGGIEWATIGSRVPAAVLLRP